KRSVSSAPPPAEVPDDRARGRPRALALPRPRRLDERLLRLAPPYAFGPGGRRPPARRRGRGHPPREPPDVRRPPHPRRAPGSRRGVRAPPRGPAHARERPRRTRPEAEAAEGDAGGAALAGGRQRARPRLLSRGPEPRVDSRHHVRPHRRGLALPRRRGGPVLPAHRGVGRPPIARPRARDGRALGGTPGPPPGAGPHPTLRPGLAVRQPRVPSAPASPRPRLLDEPSGELPR